MNTPVVEITTHSTVSQTSRDRIASAITTHRQEIGSVPREVVSLKLQREDIPASALKDAMEAVLERTPDDGSGLPSLWFAINDAFLEAIRKPAPGGRTRSATYPDGAPT